MKVVVTGARDWKDAGVIEEVFQTDWLAPANHLIVGDCRGVDRMAALVAKNLGWTVEVHKARWDLYGKAAGPIRNEEMIKQKPDVVVAFHDVIEHSKGTKHCVLTAVKAGITPVYLFTSFGTYAEITRTNMDSHLNNHVTTKE